MASDTVRFDDLRRVLRLALETRELPHGSELRMQHAVEGLCALVGAQVGISHDLVGFGSGQITVRATLDLGWSTDAERRYYRDHIADPSIPPDPSLQSFAAQAVGMASGSVVTCSREQLVTDRDWYRSAHVQEIRRPAHLDNFIASARFGEPGTVHNLALFRPWGDRPFGERERLLVDAFVRECGFLYEAPTSVPPALLRDLPPRLRDTLVGLARGRSDKQLAADLALSPHTVHSYVKALFERFGVHSRTEMLAICMPGAEAPPGRLPVPDTSRQRTREPR